MSAFWQVTDFESGDGRGEVQRAHLLIREDLADVEDRASGDARLVEAGGEIVVEGTPEAVARSRRSFTGRYLRDLLATGEVRGIA